jgi:colanic acid/amylovoran biosynthesis glycosyltransferase
MKIALIVPEFPSLSQTFVLNQITGLIDRGHQVDIFAERSDNQPKMHADISKYKLLERTYYLPSLPRNKIVRVLKGLNLSIKFIFKRPDVILRALNFFKFGRKASSLSLLFQSTPFLHKDAYDIVHCHFGPCGSLATMLKGIGVLKGKLTTVFHGYDLTSYLNQSGINCYAHLFQQGDLFLPISQTWKEKLIQLRCPEQKIKVHRMGVDTLKFSICSRKNKRKNRIDILTVARLVEKKGVRYGIEAIAKLKSNMPEIQYKIAGDGPLRTELEALIKRLGVSKKVKLLGWICQDELLKLMDKADILIAPSVTSRENDQEGIPVVLIEAMAKGIAVLSTYHSGIPEIVIDGVTGLLTRERDSDTLAERLSYLISNPDKRQELGSRGRQFIKENYDINKLNDQLVEVFYQLISQN